MEQIKELTKRLIANSFKELMLQFSFEKITIKMITDHANVIRPTFYNHFHDKYELVEWIIRDEIIDNAMELANKKQVQEAILLIFTKFNEDKEYYRRAIEITGQNGFLETLSNLLTELFMIINDSIKKDKKVEKVPLEVIGRYYASGMITIIKLLLDSEEETDEIFRIYGCLMGHKIYDITN